MKFVLNNSINKLDSAKLTHVIEYTLYEQWKWR